MTTKKLAAALTIILASAAISAAQDATAQSGITPQSGVAGQVVVEPKITVVSKGHDIRLVLTDIFSQAKKSCIIQPNIHCSLYLSLENTDFDQAVEIICKHANLEAVQQDGIYFIRRPKAADHFTATDSTLPALPPVVSTSKTAPKPDPIEPAMSKSDIETVLRKRVTTRFAKTNIRTVFDAFSTQTGIYINLDPGVPSYRLDAFLNNTSLRFALNQISRAAKLKYRVLDAHTIRISPGV
jgi:type II secretory pathway component GspD/PulD (secretin)